MTEQPENERGDETAEPTRAWGPPIDEPTAPEQTVSSPDESIEEEVADAIDEGMPLIPEDEEPVVDVDEGEPTAPTRAVAEQEPSVPDVATEPETAPSAPEPEVEVTAPTTPIGLAEPEAPETAVPVPTQAIFRDSPTEAVPDPYADPSSEEAQKLAAERAARKEARDAALAAAAPQPVIAPEPVVVRERSNDRFFASLGIMLLRLVVAGIFAIRGYQMLGDLAAAQERFAQTLLAPYAGILALGVGIVHLLIALALILGLLTRVAGLGVALVAGGALAFVWWGPWSPFVAGQAGFLGELELLLVATGLLLLFIGGGGWSIDRSFRAARARDKAARQLAP